MAKGLSQKSFSVSLYAKLEAEERRAAQEKVNTHNCISYLESF
jgi:hypothetical protein